MWRKKGLCEYVGHKAADSIDIRYEAKVNEGETQKRDMEPARTIIAVNTRCQSVIQKIRCLCEAWERLETMFAAVSEGAVDAKP